MAVTSAAASGTQPPPTATAVTPWELACLCTLVYELKATSALKSESPTPSAEAAAAENADPFAPEPVSAGQHAAFQKWLPPGWHLLKQYVGQCRDLWQDDDDADGEDGDKENPPPPAAVASSAGGAVAGAAAPSTPGKWRSLAKRISAALPTGPGRGSKQRRNRYNIGAALFRHPEKRVLALVFRGTVLTSWLNLMLGRCASAYIGLIIVDWEHARHQRLPPEAKAYGRKILERSLEWQARLDQEEVSTTAEQEEAAAPERVDPAVPDAALPTTGQAHRYQLVFAGHSAGALLAIRCAVEAQGRATVFESAGIPARGWLDSDEAYARAAALTTGYLAAPNLITTWHPHIGRTYRVHLPHTGRFGEAPERVVRIGQHEVGAAMLGQLAKASAKLAVRHFVTAAVTDKLVGGGASNAAADTEEGASDDAAAKKHAKKGPSMAVALAKSTAALAVGAVVDNNMQWMDRAVHVGTWTYGQHSIARIADAFDPADGQLRPVPAEHRFLPADVAQRRDRGDPGAETLAQVALWDAGAYVERVVQWPNAYQYQLSFGGLPWMTSLVQKMRDATTVSGMKDKARQAWSWLESAEKRPTATSTDASKDALPSYAEATTSATTDSATPETATPFQRVEGESDERCEERKVCTQLGYRVRLVPRPM